MFGKLKSTAVTTKDRLIVGARHRIRETAIKNAKKRIALSERSLESFDKDELEVIVADEEARFVTKLKTGSLVAVAVALGLH
ncbi:MAG: hypothetical protein OXI79_17170 [Gammaproteobacteria bacterium]|nr:hypothetical protein [Gammaproteobacteria bacterium]